MRLYAQIDCAFARGPKMVAAGPMARLMYVQVVLYGRENLTDGRIDKVLLPIVAIDIPAPAKQMQKLVDVGALEDHGTHWAVPPQVWVKWNPLAKQVERKRQSKRDAGALGNHRRWHVDGNRDPNCSHCATQLRDGSESQTVAPVSPKTEPETKPETDTDSRKQQQVNRTAAEHRSELLRQAATVVVSRRDLTDKSRAYVAAATKGVLVDLTEWAANRSLVGLTAEDVATEYEPPNQAGPKLREVNGRMCQHIPGSGFVPVAAS